MAVECESVSLSRVGYWKRIAQAYVFGAQNSNVSFWHTPLRLNHLGDEDMKRLRAYPQNFEDKIGRIKTMDDDGIIQLDYKGDVGLRYNPNAIAQLALGHYDRILGRQEGDESFLTQAKYFLSHYRMVDDVLLWEYDVPFENRNYLKPPWRSALAQGQGISVCLRAHRLTSDDRYLRIAMNAFNAFRYLSRLHPGGVLDDDGGDTWIEEYIFTPANHVLNGFIWALWGVRDYAVYTNDDYACSLWKSCVETLVKNLERYDLGFWTSYDLASGSNASVMPASLYYQRLHCLQMQAMHSLTREPIFLHFAERWITQLNNPLSRLRSQAWKAYFKLMRF